MSKNILFFLFLLLFVSACKGAPQTTPTLSEDVIINLPAEHSEKVGLSNVYEYELDNCNGSDVTTSEVSKSETYTHVISAGGGVEINAGGQAAIPGIGTGINLGAKVAANFNKSYGSESKESYSTTVSAPARTHKIHYIEFWKVFKTGTAEVIVNGEVHKIDYEFTDSVRVKVYTKDIDCNFPTATLTPTIPSTDTPRPSKTALRSEVEYRLSGILRILDENPTGLNNEYVIQLEQFLTGWYISGQKEYEGEGTVILIDRLMVENPSLTFLEGIGDDLQQLSQILQNRTGERTAGKRQEMDYVQLAEIQERIRTALQFLSSD